MIMLKIMKIYIILLIYYKKLVLKHLLCMQEKLCLGKFTPKQNLNIPPLKYEMVYKLKKDFPDLEIIINGGITNTDQIKNHLKKVDGVMIGRSIYHSPYFLADIEKKIYSTEKFLLEKK